MKIAKQAYTTELKELAVKRENELLHHFIFATREEARAAIFSYIELFYKRQRIHQPSGYQSPEHFEGRMVCLD
ncbi:MAG: IS3 family transposase [Rhodocyclales bacterium]|nr:IS3 family transposase [Rhodocyclales bacterium]